MSLITQMVRSPESPKPPTPLESARRIQFTKNVAAFFTIVGAAGLMFYPATMQDFFDIVRSPNFPQDKELFRSAAHIMEFQAATFAALSVGARLYWEYFLLKRKK